MNTLRSLCIVLSVALGACSTRLSNAPVVDRSRPSGALLHPPVLQTVPPGYYRVQPGDTLYRIALDHGQHYLDVARWNHLPNPDQIEVNQLLRVVPPADEANAPAQTSIADADRAAAQTQPLNGVSAAPGTPLTLSSPAQPGPEAARAGAPIQASAAGRVVYAGNGLRGYAHLIIVKHNATFLTAYAHNRKLFARENETVAQGQKIAEMGDSDAKRVMLHFEVRKQGKPVDPLLYLPKP